MLEACDWTLLMLGGGWKGVGEVWDGAVAHFVEMRKPT
jgi:hypothetical protein